MKFHLSNLPEELKAPLKEIAPQLSFAICDDGRAVRIKKGDHPRIDATQEIILLEYHKTVEFFRLLTLLPSHTEGVYEEAPAHEDLCLMSDCSRNAVFNMQGAKKMIHALALMGFTSFMLYTEDTYEIPEYPFFGYQRGRFSQKELKEIDDYAASFGIELIPCIQVLAHLEQALRWPAFKEITDTGDILLVGKEKTYQLIDCMIKSCRNAFRSKRIHIGMDEAHLLGAGKYLDQNGYRPRTEILLEHLQRVCKICADYDFSPMIWSDMFFRVQFGGQYYVGEGEIEQATVDLVPEEVSLVYWDYYTGDEKVFRHMVNCHQQFKNPIIFAGGAWKWYDLCPFNQYSMGRNEIHLRICREEKIPMVIATAWGNDGAVCSEFSVMATLQQYAEYCYAKGEDRAWVAKRFEETFKLPFDTFLLLDSPSLLPGIDQQDHPQDMASLLLYNDPLGGWLDQKVRPDFGEEYAKKEQALKGIKENGFSLQFQTSAALCSLLKEKATLSYDIRMAYQNKDSKTLASIARERIPRVQKALSRYHLALREEWYSERKAIGFEVNELHIGGLKERLSTAAWTIEQYLSGALPAIEQLEEELLDTHHRYIKNWSKIASCNSVV